MPLFHFQGSICAFANEITFALVSHFFCCICLGTVLACWFCRLIALNRFSALATCIIILSRLAGSRSLRLSSAINSTKLTRSLADSSNSTLDAGATEIGKHVWSSPSGQCTLELLTDGALVLYNQQAQCDICGVSESDSSSSCKCPTAACPCDDGRALVWQTNVYSSASASTSRIKMQASAIHNQMQYKHFQTLLKFSALRLFACAHTSYTQDDGNLVVLVQGEPVWQTGTTGNPSAYMSIADDNTFSVYTKENSTAIWKSSSTLQRGLTLVAPADIASPDGMYTVSLASDGTLSGFRTGVTEPLWTVGSASNASRIEMIMEVLT
jgi:hypothetical protein